LLSECAFVDETSKAVALAAILTVALRATVLAALTIYAHWASGL
jgi:hypothetical protein